MLRIEQKDLYTKARKGILRTPHGQVNTPVYMPVGTVGSVKGLTPDELRECGAQLILSNTFHLYLRPGDELIARFSGLHKFMGWDGPILTDSGGYQVFSLSALRKITDEGVIFQSPIDGSEHFFSPEKVVAIQENLGSDIMVCLDECIPYESTYEYAKQSTDLTIEWARRSLRAFSKGKGQALFCVIQGGFYRDLREYCIENLGKMDFDGYAIGGFSVGEPKEAMYELLQGIVPLLPEDSPRYLMGVGLPEDIVEGVSMGIDMFDCVVPTRHGRRGYFFTSSGHINIRNAIYREDDTPIEVDCDCYTCRKYSRAYLRHLFASGDLLGARLGTIHNIRYFSRLMEQIREAIASQGFEEFKERFYRVRKEVEKC